jgi:hypothetical protein
LRPEGANSRSAPGGRPSSTSASTTGDAPNPRRERTNEEPQRTPTMHSAPSCSTTSTRHPVGGPPFGERSSTASGRIPSVHPSRPASAPNAARTRASGSGTSTPSAWKRTTPSSPARRPRSSDIGGVPMKLATKRVEGWS